MLHILTDSRIRAVAPAERTRKLFDGGGLYLEVAPRGGRWWRLKYRYQGIEKRLSLGTYPAVTLKLARERAAEARQQVARGIDPSAARQATKAALRTSAEVADSFEVVMREWHHTAYAPGVSAGQAQRTLSRLERDVLPWIGGQSVASLKASQILQVLRRVESRGAVETAHRELQAISQVMRYAVATGRAERDPTGDLRGALRPVRTDHFPAIVEPRRVGALLRAIDGYEGTFHVRCALRLAPLLFVRPGELRGAAWAEFDLDGNVDGTNGGSSENLGPLWRIPAERMKGTQAEKARGREHVVPLARQAVAILRELRPLTGHRQHLFPCNRAQGRTISDMTLNAALRRVGFAREEMTTHGFRAMARTMLVERLGFDEAIVEAQLAHRVRDALGRAYNRTSFLAQRAQMMQAWADYLDTLRAA